MSKAKKAAKTILGKPMVLKSDCIGDEIAYLVRDDKGKIHRVVVDIIHLGELSAQEYALKKVTDPAPNIIIS